MLTAEPRLEEIRAARERIAGVALRSPLLPLHDAASPGVWLKLENLQPTGSFKVRGATNLVEQLDPGSIAEGLLTASAGNMGQAVAWSAQRLGLRCTVIVPDTAASNKTEAVERAAPLEASLAAGHPVEVPYERSFVDGIGSRTVMPEMLDLARELIDGVLVAGVEVVEAAVAVLFRRNRVVAEGAGACPVAIARSERVTGRSIACVVSDGNIDAATLFEILSRHQEAGNAVPQ